MTKHHFSQAEFQTTTCWLFAEGIHSRYLNGEKSCTRSFLTVCVNTLNYLAIRHYTTTFQPSQFLSSRNMIMGCTMVG